MCRKLIYLFSLVLVFSLASGLVSTAQAAPKYVIFLIGDGMGFEQVKAGGMYVNGQAGTLSFESFPYNGELTTHSADSAVTDSAAAGTALATGVKVNYFVVSMAYPGDGSELETLLEYYKARGKSTGLVTTTNMTHATPASFGAHELSRMSYEQIADDYRLQTQPNVLFGGGADGMTIEEFENAGYTVVTDYASMQALDTENIDMVSGQFGGGYMPYEYDGLGSLPHLSEMTATALSILDNDPDGFFLMVEGGRIDHACHGNDIQRTVLETVEFDNTVQVAIDWAAGRSDTLILVTADHETGGLTVLANNGAGVLPTVAWSSGDHTGVNVPVYAWGVNAELISGVMDNTDMFAVVTTSGPEASNPDPQNGGTSVWLPPVLSWTPGKYAASHQVYFGSVFDDVNNATGASPQADVTYVPAGPFEVSTTYYWRVDEVNDLDTNSPWVGSVWSFTTAPGNSTQPDPANGAVGVAIDAIPGWLPGPTAAARDVYFGTSSPPAFIDNQTEPNFNPGPLEPGTTYYWQVDEVEADGTTIYTGDIWSFTTVPGYSTQPDPANNAVGVALDKVLSWLPGPTAATHDVYFGTSSPPSFIGNQAESSFDPNGLEPNTTYYWQIDEIEADGTTIHTGDIWSFKTPRPGTGTILLEIWGGLGYGNVVSDLTGNENYPYSPMFSDEIMSFEAPTDIGDAFGSRLHGYLHPETSGDYTFWIASNDNGELWLSTDESPANTVLISTTSGLAAPRDFDSFAVTPSGPIHLEADQKYYIMALYKESWSNDNCAVAWEGPDSPTRAVIAGYYLSPFVQLAAYSPSPTDGTTEVKRTPILSWSVGKNTASVNGHELYFSSDVDAVNDRIAEKVVLSEPSYFITTKLDTGKTYYWCVDEVDADGITRHIGDVWSFTVTTIAGR